jgi:hypothetical protein
MYDLNGNLSKDPDRQITFVHYNYLNLVDTITYQDGVKSFMDIPTPGKSFNSMLCWPMEL